MFATAVLVSPSPSVIVAVSVIRFGRQHRRRSAMPRQDPVHRRGPRPHLVERHSAVWRSPYREHVIAAALTAFDHPAVELKRDRRTGQRVDQTCRSPR